MGRRKRVVRLLRFRNAAGCAKIRASLISRTRWTMNAKLVSLSAPFISRDASLWFSAYGFGWGYCAFSIPIEAVCEYLGAAGASTKQLILAFLFGKNPLSKVVQPG